MKIILLFLFLISLNSSPYSQDTLYLTANYIPGTDTVLVYLPAKFKKTEKYPLVFFLHGWSGSWRQWSEITDMQALANEFNFIIVTPDGFYDSWYVNSPIKPNSQWQKFFFNDLVPAIFTNYNVDSNNIFITGLSMGGHGAMLMFLKHSKFFKAAGSTSGILDITEFPDRWSMLNALGKYGENKESWRNNSAYYRIKNIAGTDKRIIFDCGIDDFAYKVNKKFYEKCLELKVKATFISQPGNHNKDYWKESVKYHFVFFNRMVNESKIISLQNK